MTYWVQYTDSKGKKGTKRTDLHTDDIARARSRVVKNINSLDKVGWIFRSKDYTTPTGFIVFDPDYGCPIWSARNPKTMEIRNHIVRADGSITLIQ